MQNRYAIIGNDIAIEVMAESLRYLGAELDIINTSSVDELETILGGNAYQGFVIMHPFLSHAAKFVNNLEGYAKKSRRVNVIRMDHVGSLVGYDTSKESFKDLIEQSLPTNLNRRTTKSVIIGTKASAVAAKNALEESGFDRIYLVEPRELPAHKDANILINATNIGSRLAPNISPLDNLPLNPKSFSSSVLLIDQVADPLRTKLVLGFAQKRQAKRTPSTQNTQTRSGIDLITRNAISATSILRGQTLDGEAVHFAKQELAEVKRHALESQANLILVGMPGCGKSSVARKIAEETGMALVDLDKEVQALMGEKINQVLTNPDKGEEYFRNFETKTLINVCQNKGQVIATGGGCILRHANRRIMKENGIVIYIKRPLSLLSVKNRPLSKAKGVEKLYKERGHLYVDAADIIVTNAFNFGESYNREGLKNSYRYDLKRFAYRIIRKYNEKFEEIANK